LINHPDKREAMGKALHQRALEHFCIDAMNEKFIEFIETKIFKS
jgi:hypothetical protein